MILIPRLLKFMRLWLEFLLHGAQLLDEGCEGNSLLGLVLPALAHQIINLPKGKKQNACSNPLKDITCEVFVL